MIWNFLLILILVALNGFFLGHLDHIPTIGEEIILTSGIQLRVTEMDGLRIAKIQITGV